jgi:hypothetical protein
MRQMRPRAVGLPDDQEVFGAVPGPAEHLDFKTHPRVERIVDANQLYALFAGSM